MQEYNLRRYKDGYPMTRLEIQYGSLFDLSFLKGDTMLTSVDASDNLIQSIGFMRGNETLTELDLFANSIYKLKPLKHNTTLTRLNVGDNHIETLKYLRNTSIQSIGVSSNPLENGGVYLWDSLSCLDLSMTAVTNIEFMKSNSTLASLTIHSCNISDLSPLEGNDSLTTLSLGWNNITDVSPISSISSLIHLNLQHNKITDIECIGGNNHPHLLTLDVSINDIQDTRSFDNLAYHPYLKKIDYTNSIDRRMIEPHSFPYDELARIFISLTYYNSKNEELRDITYHNLLIIKVVK